MTNSCQKGKAGERELAALLRKFGFEARRGQQFKGTPDSPDVVSSMSGFHIECKRVERLNLYDAVHKAKEDCGPDDDPIVFHRRNKEKWVVVMDAEDFLRMMKDEVYAPRD